MIFLIHSALRYYPDGWLMIDTFVMFGKDVACLTFGLGEVCSLGTGSLMKNTKTKDPGSSDSTYLDTE